MIVLDNFLDQDSFLMLKASIQSPQFPWVLRAVLKDPPPQLDPADNLQHVHGFFLDSPGHRHISPNFSMVRGLIDKIAPAHLMKVKLNRTTRKDRHIEYGLHLDTRRPGATTAVLYLNSNNGYTLFETGEKVMSVENRLALFDARLWHTGVSCTDAEFRYVLNLNMMLNRDNPLRP